MAKLIQAIVAYRPRIELEKAATVERYVELAAARTTLSPGVIRNVQETDVETLTGLLAEGRPVHTGAAIYTPRIGLDGRIRVSVRVDRRILNKLNAADGFHGRVRNAENVGRSAADLAAIWDEEHPDDPVT